ncbi:CoA transferase [Paraburkholderia ferrariae]|uniref:CoA transferase n=1 Tax=Paraburkholderia ferrariae TaxID=386056 RepID=A0ABU9S4C3_9BURK
MDKLGLGYVALSRVNPRLVYASHKGFLPGPYDHRTALDEVVQMMGGLAYMTGPEGRPLSAGTSVNDIMGGMFGAMAALAQREGTGRGQEVPSVVREQCVPRSPAHDAVCRDGPGRGADAEPHFRVGCLRRVFGQERGADFLVVVSDTQWALFCDAFGLAEVTLPSDASGAGRPIETRTPLRPLTLGGERLQLRAGPP